MAQLEPNQLLADLANFTGTTQYFHTPMFPDFRYTDGARFLFEKAEAYWLRDFIFSNQLQPKVKAQPFQVWKIKVVNNEGFVSVEDGNDNVVKSYTIPYTDFSLEEYSLWFIEGVLLLNSEH